MSVFGVFLTELGVFLTFGLNTERYSVSLFSPNARKYRSEKLRKLLRFKKLLRFCPYFPAFGLNTERYRVSLPIQSKCGKIRTRKTPNTNNFHAVYIIYIIYVIYISTYFHKLSLRFFY